MVKKEAVYTLMGNYYVNSPFGTFKFPVKLVEKKVNKSSKTVTNEQQTPVSTDPDCVEFVALWASGDIAEQLGKDKKWVFLNYTVDLWDIPPSDGAGNIVGKLRASSYARIIEKKGNDYKVESPINQVHGWLGNKHVKTISKKNINTRALCE